VTEADLDPTNATHPAVGANVPGRDHVVILVHGIRDYALWQDAIRTELESEGFKVELSNYERLNLVEFLEPSTILRRRAIAEVWEDIKTIRQNNRNALISVIAHSSGTYVIARLMQKNFDAVFHRVIFCGSVVRYRFPFKKLQNQFTQPILNEVGTRDIWPALAESVTIGYGSAGTYGFRKPLIRDRWHNGAHHGYFLEPTFCKTYWVPFLRDGKLTPGSKKPEPPSPLLVLLSIFKLKYILVAIALYFTVGWGEKYCCSWQHPKTFSVTDYLGSWRNKPDARGISRVTLREDGADLKLKVWGVCVPTDCEMEEIKAAVYGKDVQSRAQANVSTIEADHKASWSEAHFTLRLIDSDTLSVGTRTHFTDDSGRSDYQVTETLRRSPR